MRRGALVPITIAVFATVLTAAVAMAAGPTRTVPTGSVRFITPGPALGSQGLSLSARQNKQGSGALLPAVQKIRCWNQCR